MNENKYKETFNNISPSEEAVERIYEITTDKKKYSYKIFAKRAIAASMAFIIAIGIGFGADWIPKSTIEPNTEQNNPEPSNKNENNLGVLVAYAGEKEFLQIQNKNDTQKFFGKLYVAFHSDEEKLQKIHDEYSKEQDRIDKIVEKYIQDGEPDNRPISCSSHIDYIYDADDLYQEIEKGWIISLYEGELTLNIDDYSNVKDITFENSSKYGELILEHYTWKPVQTLEGHKITVLGKELQYAIDNGFCLPKGYIFGWNITNSLLEEFAADENFDLSNIKDTITFTVNYLDGTTEQASVDLSFDKDGYMHLSDNSLTK